MEVKTPFPGLLDEPAVAVEIRLFRRLRGDGNAPVQEVHLLFGDELRVARLSAVQVEDGPFDEVFRRAADRARRPDDGQPPEGLLVAEHRPDVHLAALALEGVGEGGRPVGQRGAEPLAVQRRVRHPEGREDALADVLLPGFARHLLDDHRGGDERDVVVLVVAPEGVGGRHQFQHPVDVVAVVAQVAQVGADVVAQAGPVRGQVLDLDVFRDPGVEQFEVGKVVLYAVVPAQEPLIGQLRQDGCGERLGDGPDLEEGVRIDRRAGGKVLDAVALAEKDFPVLVEGHAHAGNLPVLHDLADGGFDVGDNGVLGERGMALRDVFHRLRAARNGQQRYD